MADLGAVFQREMIVRLVRVSAYLLVGVLLLLIGLCSYEGIRVSSSNEMGKLWCMGIIEGFSRDGSKLSFDEVHGTTKVKKMDPEGLAGMTTPSFFVREDGNFSCSVPEQSTLALFPAVHVYERDVGAWVRRD